MIKWKMDKKYVERRTVLKVLVGQALVFIYVELILYSIFG